MNPVSEIRPMTPRPVTLAGPGNQTAKAVAAAADPQSVAPARPAAPAPAAQARAPEAVRPQRPEHRWSENRVEREQSRNGKGVPEAELSFGDFLDLINPLQHIPIVGTIYRAITGDEISGPAKILGGLLFGGPIGFIVSLFNAVVEEETGQGLGETVLAAFVEPDAAPAVQVAEAPDIEERSVQDATTEDSTLAAGGVPSPSFVPVSGPESAPVSAPESDFTDPFGLERGVTATIAATPFAVPPRPQTATLAVASAPVIPVERVSADVPNSGAPRLVPNIATPELGFTKRMLEALDKYQALSSERFRENNPEKDRLDLEL